MKRILGFLAVLAVLASGFVSTGLAGGRVLTIGIAKEPANLNPILIPGLYGEALAGNIFDTLISFKESASNPAPALAERWTITDDGKEYTFYLRKGVKFHNGMKMTARDVKFTLEAIMDPKNASPSKEFFSPIDRIVVMGDYAIKLILRDPYAPFLLALGNPTAGIVPEKVVRKVGMDRFDRHPVGTGAFKFVEWRPDDRIVLDKNPDYYLGAPRLDKVVFRPIPKPEVMAAEIEAGGIDIAQKLLPQDIKRLGNNRRLQVKTVAGLSNSYLGFSFVKAPFSDVRFRKALYHAIPFEAAVKGIWRDVGSRSYSWIPPGVFPEDTAYMKSRALSYDREKARRLFDKLKAEGVVKEGFEFSIYTPQNPYRAKMATAVVSELRKFGIKAKVETLEWGSLFPLLKKGVGVYIMGWGSVPDPDRWTYKIFHSGSTMNFSKYDRPEIDKALERGRILVGVEKRGEQYRKVMRQTLATDYIHIPLVFKSETAIVSKKVRDFSPSPQGYFHLVTAKRNVSLR
ncbi:MAG: ABC transporter substrate-binding protein [Proteobacteria bacterium]|nr:ABC transporter substrate-binding protein [Pseudomonadota bacterium]